MTTLQPDRKDTATLDAVELHVDKYTRASQLLTDTVRTLIGSQEFDEAQQVRLTTLKEKLFEAADLLIYAAEDIGKIAPNRVTGKKSDLQLSVTIDDQTVQLNNDELIILAALVRSNGQPVHPSDIYSSDGFHDDISIGGRRQAFTKAIKQLMASAQMNGGQTLIIGEGNTRARTYRITPDHAVVIDDGQQSEPHKPTVLEALTPNLPDIITKILEKNPKPFITLLEMNAVAFHGRPSDKDFHELKQVLANDRRLTYVGDGIYCVKDRATEGSEWVNVEELQSYIDEAIRTAYDNNDKTVNANELVRTLHKRTVFLIRAERTKLEELLRADTRIAAVSGSIYILAPKPTPLGITPASIAHFSRLGK